MPDSDNPKVSSSKSIPTVKLTLVNNIDHIAQQINVLYFAAAKDITGRSSEELELPPTLKDLTEILNSKYGDDLRKVMDHSLYAINMEYIEKKDERNTELKDKDEVALIPPVSGG